MIDSLQLFETLKSHVPDPQARVITMALQQTETFIRSDLRAQVQDTLATVATKADVNQAMVSLRAEFKQDIAGLRADFNDDLAGFRSEVKHEIAELRDRITTSESKVIRWAFVFWIGQVAVLVALLKLVR